MTSKVVSLGKDKVLAWFAPLLLAVFATVVQAQSDILVRVQTLPVQDAYAAAQEAVASGELTGAERRFVHAVLLARTGQLAQAETELRSLLQQHPELDKVRYLLVQVKAQQGKYGRARLQLTRLMRPGADPELLQLYRQLDRQLVADNPWRFTYVFALEPTNNINRATDKQVVEIFGLPFEIDNATAARRGVRTSLQFGAQRRFALSDRTSAALGGFASFVSDGEKTRDNLELGLTAALSTELAQNTTLSANLSLMRNFVARNPRFDRRLGSVTLRFPLAAKISQAVTIGQSYTDYEHPLIKDGATRFVSTQFLLRPSQTRLLRFGASLSQARAQRLRDQYDSGSLSFGISQNLGKQILLDAGLTLGRRKFLGPNPLTGQRQKDSFRVFEGDVTFGNLQLWGFAPKLGVRYEQVDSSFAAKSFDTFGASFTLTRQF
jgi:hypothetical protein